MPVKEKQSSTLVHWFLHLFCSCTHHLLLTGQKRELYGLPKANERIAIHNIHDDFILTLLFTQQLVYFHPATETSVRFLFHILDQTPFSNLKFSKRLQKEKSF